MKRKMVFQGMLYLKAYDKTPSLSFLVFFRFIFITSQSEWDSIINAIVYVLAR
jgi:hypothetical protein